MGLAAVPKKRKESDKDEVDGADPDPAKRQEAGARLEIPSS